MNPQCTLFIILKNKCGKGETICNCIKNPTDLGVKVKRDDKIPEITGFVALIHELSNGQTFTLLPSLGNERIGDGGQSIPKVTKVSVFYWEKDGDYDEPLLLEVSLNDQSKQYYYRYDGCETEARGNPNIWRYIQDIYPLQERLDDRNCGRNNAIVFKIDDPTSDHYSTNSNCLKTTRKITRSTSPPSPPNSDYTVQEYTVGGSGTQISRITYNGSPVEITLPNDYTVSRVRVHSYPDSGDDTPLMLQFMKHDGRSKWYYSKDSDGTKWEEVNKTDGFYNGDKGEIPTEALTTGLDDVRCFRDSGVTINLSFTNSSSLSQNSAGGDKKYCCHYHKSPSSNDQGKVTVTSVPVFCKVETHKNTSSITAYKHTIGNGGVKLAGIKYYENGDATNRKNIKLSELEFPISGPLTIYVFYCQQNPLLIYVKGEGSDATGWYKKGDSADRWTKVSEALEGIAPENFGDLTCGKWKILVGLLKGVGCNNLKECPTDNSSFWVKLFGGGGASALATGGAGGAGWHVYNNYFLDALVRLI